MSRPDRWFFVHLQKTGGTALFQRLRDAVGPDAIYPLPHDRGEVAAVLDVDHLRDELRRHGDQIQVVTGHFPLCAAGLMGDHVRTFTILRDPVERTLSLLRRRQEIDDRFHGLDLAAIYRDDRLRPFVRNHMVKMLSIRPEAMGRTPLTLDVDLGADDLQAAVENLARVEVVGLQERFDELCDELAARYSWDLGPARVANRTAPRPVPAGLRDEIAADNHLDVQLYRAAVELVSARDAARVPGGG